MSYDIKFTKQAAKDYEKIKTSNLKTKVKNLLVLLKETPSKPPIEKLTGDLSGLYSKRINIQHRLVYRIDEKEKIVVIVRMWSHYGDN